MSRRLVPANGRTVVPFVVIRALARRMLASGECSTRRLTEINTNIAVIPNRGGSENEASHRTPALPRDHLPVVQPDQASIDKVRFPDMADLMARLHISGSDGRIWLDDQRMLLVHAKALGSLRREMIEALGVEVARGFLTRMGYHAGACDAQMARKVRPTTNLKDMFVVGPQMHCLEGIGLSEAVRLEFDVERGKHYGEFIWTSPVEDEEHARHFAIGTEAKASAE